MTAQAGGAALVRPAAMNDADRLQLRRQMRTLRRALPAERRCMAALRYAQLLRRALLLRPKRRIAVYFSHDHEADLSVMIDAARRCGCELYLPAIVDYRRYRMEFLPYPVDADLRRNRFGIPEPPLGLAAAIPVRHLDLILLPLVAADARGGRVGSGAGYYDRRLHHLRAERRWRRPKLIGVGYEFQRVPQLRPARWDVPLDALLTEQALYWTSGNEQRLTGLP